MKLKNIPYITLWANKFDEVADFYKNKLELHIESENSNFIQFDTSGTKLYIHRIMSENKEGLRSNVLEVHFSVEDVDKVVEELKAKGLVFEKEPENWPWGRIASIKDPEGFTVELVGPIKEGEPTKSYT